MGRLKNIGTDTDADYFASYAYDKYSSLDEAKANNNSIITDYQYNNLGQLTILKNSFAGKYYEEKLFYENNYRGLISSIQHNYSFSTNGAASYSTTYGYDELGRLKSADNSGGIAGNDLTSATFDDNGNVLSYSYNGISKNYQYYTNNHVKNTDGSGTDYQYDAIGNIVNSPVASSITYHKVINLPLQVNAGGNQLNLQYNGGNQRVLSDDGIQKRMYIHGTNDYPMLEKVKDGQGNEKIIQYIYGNSGLLAMKDGSGDWNFMLKDHLGSNRLVLNSSNVILGRYDFAAYGQLMGNSTYDWA